MILILSTLIFPYSLTLILMGTRQASVASTQVSRTLTERRERTRPSGWMCIGGQRNWVPVEEGRGGRAGQVLNQEAGEGLAKGRLEQRLIPRRDQLSSHLEKRNWEMEQPEEKDSE